MKKYLLISILIIGCSSNAPENLISEEKMEKQKIKYFNILWPKI